jgi:hypothetical protein
VGVECYRAFQGAVKSNAAATQLGMLALNAASSTNSGNGQSQKFANSAADLSASEASLAALIAAGQQARASVDTYLHGIYLPEDYNMEDDDFQEMFGSADEFLNGQPCFYDNEQNLKGLLRKFDTDLAQLAKTKAAVTVMRATNSAHVTDTTSLNAATASGTSRGSAGQAPTARGTPKPPASSITGVEQDRAKQQQKNP